MMVRSGAMTRTFFSDHGVYSTDPHAENRLNERYNRIIAPNLAGIRGSRVLDLGAHDGRWSWAALASGAAFVTGVEGRSAIAGALVGPLTEGFADHYEMIAGDVFEVLPSLSPGRFDTILCLGIFYHVLNHDLLVGLMARLEPKLIVLDSRLVDTDELLITLHHEDTSNPLNGIGAEERVLVGIPSRGAVAALAERHGYTTRHIDWNAADIPDHHHLNDYLRRDRFTVVLEPIAAGPA